MRQSNYYSSGEFARMAHVTVRTIRYYDKQNILNPSYVNGTGTRFYSDEDLAKLQQILLLKYLGFSLTDIREMTIPGSNYRFMLDALNVQIKLVRDRIEQMQSVERAIEDTAEAIRAERSIDWSQMLNLIHLTSMEKSVKNQYQDASNISSRINLHSIYSKNEKGWFPWVYEQCQVKSGMHILEAGCGDGSLWRESLTKLPDNVNIKLTDISKGMIRDARRTMGIIDKRFEFQVFDYQRIPYVDKCFDIVIANHLLFYCESIDKVCKETKRVLKKDGTFLCSTYGRNHMKEISKLVQEFDDRIVLSADKLYEKFGKANGEKLLKSYFSSVEWRDYSDELIVLDAEPLISYILSCHGNQGQYILERYNEFCGFVKKKMGKGFPITKEAGIYVCVK